MAVKNVILTPGGFLSTALVNLFTADAFTQITTATFANTDTVPHYVTVNMVRSGGTPGPSNQIMSVQAIAPGQPFTAPALSGRNFAPGDALVAFADADGVVTAFIDGFTVS